MLLFLATGLHAQEQSEIDPGAVALLDKMSAVIGDLESCSFELFLSKDEEHHQYGMLTRHSRHKVYLKGPDKIQVQSWRYNDDRAMWYNGAYLWYYSLRQNNYSRLPMQGNIISVFDSLHFNYGIDFPAADIFYPAFTDDVLESFKQIHIIGEAHIDGSPCFHILASNEDTRLEIWIAQDAFNLPLKFSIVQTKDGVMERYEARFKDWSVNPVLPDSMFEFKVPPNSRSIDMIPKNR